MPNTLELFQEISKELLQGTFKNDERWDNIIIKVQSNPEQRVSQEIIAALQQLILHCEQEIKKENSHAIHLRAYMHQHGQGGLVAYRKAIALYEQAIALGNANAMINRAYMHKHGQGGSVDYSKAIALYERAIALENSNAMSNRAYMHQEGQGGSVDYPKAIALYERAIALEDVSAMNNRAHMHIFGEGGPVDYPKAIALYEQAARAGYNPAKENLKSISVTIDHAEELLNLIWPDLVNGYSFSSNTIDSMQTYCKDQIIHKIQTSPLGSSLEFLKQLALHPQHPLTLILNAGQQGRFTEYFKKLMAPVHDLAMQRRLMSSIFEQKAKIKSPELAEHSLLFFQPSYSIDKKISLETTSEVRRQIETVLEKSPSTTLWPLDWAESRYDITYNNTVYHVPEGIYHLYNATQNDKINVDAIRNIINHKAQIKGSIVTFFKSILGLKHSSESTDFYKQLEQTCGRCLNFNI